MSDAESAAEAETGAGHDPDPELEVEPDTEPEPSDVETSTMREPKIEKVVVHMGVGAGGRDLERAEGILQDLTDQQPVRTQAKSTVPAFNIREGTPIGAKVTLRGERAADFLETALQLVALSASQFDEFGNVSFGIPEHTDFPGQEYDPTIGIYGLDVTVNLTRPGYRVTKRNIASRSIPSAHRLGPTDAIAFLESRFDATIERGDEDE